jgi:outer membrane protein
LQKLDKEGAISPPQVYDIRGQLKDAQLGEIDARNAWAAAKLQLSQLMTLPFDSTLQLQRIDAAELLEPFALSLNEVISKANQSLAVIKADELRTKSAAAAVRATKGALLPTLSLGSNLNTNFSSAASREIPLGLVEQPSSSYVLVNGSKQAVIVQRQNVKQESIGYGSQFKNNVFSNFGLSIRVPILNSMYYRNQVNLAAINLKAADLEAQSTKVLLRQEIEQAYLNMNNAWERYNILGEQVDAYGESFRAAEVRFAAGVGTSVDYVIAKTNLDRSQINLVSAKYDYLLRKRVLQFYSESKTY